MESTWKPLIGITPSAVPYSADHGEFRRYASMTAYPDAVEAAGGIPVVLPFLAGDVRGLVDRLDGVLLSGGADVAPERYGDAEVHPDTYDVDPARDAFEIALAREALGRGKPILAICRGIQVLNVALGGTLHQHVPDVFSGPSHRQHQAEPPVPADQASHGVTVCAGTALAAAVGEGELAVNSFHHQGLRDLAPDLVATAVGPDGLTEAVEHRTLPGVVGVQWHPELMAPTDDRQAALFRNLVQSASTAALTR